MRFELGIGALSFLEVAEWIKTIKSCILVQLSVSEDHLIDKLLFYGEIASISNEKVESEGFTYLVV